jgi:hypothetical protein
MNWIGINPNHAFAGALIALAIFGCSHFPLTVISGDISIFWQFWLVGETI